MLNPVQFESLVRDTVERVLEGGQLEDSRFEAKAKLPRQLLRTAERLAGHANASRGQPIIWLIGLDEDACSFGPEPKVDLAELLPQLGKLFDGREIPRLLRDHRFYFDEKSVLALEFDTSYPPYVVNRQTGNEWTFAIPWRYGTRVMAARRDQIRELLTRQLSGPDVRPLDLSFEVQPSDWITISGRLLFTLPTGAQPVFLPTVDMRSSVGTAKTRTPVNLEWGEPKPIEPVGGHQVGWSGGGRERYDSDAHATEAGIYVGSIGSVAFGAAGELITGQELGTLKRAQRALFRFEAIVANSDSAVRVEATLVRDKSSEGGVFRWQLETK
jgi:hypothetical protein